jgi:hypothetical protein
VSSPSPKCKIPDGKASDTRPLAKEAVYTN